MISYRFNRTTLTPEAIEFAKWFYIDLCERCLADVLSGRQKVNDKAAYIARQTMEVDDLMGYAYGEMPVSLTTLQRAYYEQTGESVALLP